MHMPELGQVGLCPSLMCYSYIGTSYQKLRCRLCCKRHFRELGNWAKLRGKIGGWGVSPTGKSFRVVRACVRAVRMPSEIRVGNPVLALSLFPFGPGRSSLFPSGL